MTITPLIHIGYHKTATTWLQAQLFSGRLPFLPLSRDTARPNSLARDFIFERGGACLSPFAPYAEGLQDELAYFETLYSQKAGMPVMSHERLSGNPHSGGFDAKTISHRLFDTFPKAKILITIRSQATALDSNYFQYLKIGGTLDVEDYLSGRYDGKSPGFSARHFNYALLITHYRALFGTDQVRVLPYELFRQTPLDFCAALGEFIGHDIDVQGLDFDMKINAKADRLALYNERALSLMDKPSSVHGFVQLSSQARSVLEGQGLKFETLAELQAHIDKAVAPYLSGYKDGNETLAAMSGYPLQSWGYP